MAWSSPGLEFDSPSAPISTTYSMTLQEINAEMAELREKRLAALREADRIQDQLNDLQRQRRTLALAERVK
ncbi:hypothetical protein [Synechococcus phage S-B68]|nr:hypothetical protein [Synechococcus phage S-B68]